MIAKGMAWANRKYLRDSSLLDLEESARLKRLGLWEDPAPIPPWEYRKHGKEGDPTSVLSVSEDIGPVKRSKDQKKEQGTFEGISLGRIEEKTECGTKRFCKEMADCEEARFYLEHCDREKLDADGDGIPYENICGH